MLVGLPAVSLVASPLFVLLAPFLNCLSFFLSRTGHVSVRDEKNMKSKAIVVINVLFEPKFVFQENCCHALTLDQWETTIILKNRGSKKRCDIELV